MELSFTEKKSIRKNFGKLKEILSIPKTNSTVTKIAAIILFTSNESILIFFKMHI